MSSSRRRSDGFVSLALTPRPCESETGGVGGTDGGDFEVLDFMAGPTGSMSGEANARTSGGASIFAAVKYLPNRANIFQYLQSNC